MQIKKKEIKFEQPSELLLLVNRYLLFILFFLVVAILGGTYFFLLTPKIESINLVKEQEIETEQKRRLNEGLLVRIIELEKEYLDIRENRINDLEKLKKILPSEPEIAELFVLADRLASKHSFLLSSINVSDRIEGTAGRRSEPLEEQDSALTKIEGEEIRTLAVNFNIVRLPELIDPEEENIIRDDEENDTNIYDDFKAYIDDLQKNLRLMDIQTISFGELTDSQGGAAFSLNIITYYR